jgi:hypothetical protein
MDEVIITPPYNEENCKANASSVASLARVKKVVSDSLPHVNIVDVGIRLTVL